MPPAPEAPSLETPSLDWQTETSTPSPATAVAEEPCDGIAQRISPETPRGATLQIGDSAPSVGTADAGRQGLTRSAPVEVEVDGARLKVEGRAGGCADATEQALSQLKDSKNPSLIGAKRACLPDDFKYSHNFVELRDGRILDPTLRKNLMYDGCPPGQLPPEGQYVFSPEEHARYCESFKKPAAPIGDTQLTGVVPHDLDWSDVAPKSTPGTPVSTQGAAAPGAAASTARTLGALGDAADVPAPPTTDLDLASPEARNHIWMATRPGAVTGRVAASRERRSSRAHGPTSRSWRRSPTLRRTRTPAGRSRRVAPEPRSPRPGTP